MPQWGAYRKFNNRPMRCTQGVTHHSQKEARRCNELHVLQSAGAISALEAHPQPRFPLVVNGVEICKYVADFRYMEEDGAIVVEDVKGHRTPEYLLKKRLMLAQGIEVRET